MKIRVFLTALLALAALPAAAQQYPSRPITIICGYGPGTGADVISRYFAEKLRVLGGQPVVVENKAGAQTMVSAEYVANAKPDGYTILLAPGNSTFAANAHLFKKMPFDPIKDFTPITTMASLPFVVAVAPDSPINSMKDLTAHLKAKGAKASYAYSTPFGQAASELYKKLTGAPGVPVPYRSGVAIIPDLKSGEVDFMFADSGTAMLQKQQGFLKLIAVSTAERSPVAPEYPGMKEAGIPDFDLGAWFGAWLPAKSPQAIVDKLEGWINQIVVTDETREFLLRVSYAPMPGNQKMLAELTPREIEKWGRIIRDANIEPQ